uniref:pectinesterase n=2 Tax=Oryza brachyantha TaxID=4533 RepID=J3NA10_ORYBR
MRMSTSTPVVLLLGLAVLAALPSPSSQQPESEKALQSWIGWNDQLYNSPMAEDPPPLNGDLVAANNSIVRVAVDGGSIADALAAVPNGNTKRYIFSLKPGAVFREKVVVEKGRRFVTFKSDPANPAVVVWNDTAATLGKDGKPLGAVGSATLAVKAEYFLAYGVVFKNDGQSAGAKRGQTVAVRVAGSMAAFYNCTIDGGQGALYDDEGQHYFKDCTINGGADAIFGFGRSLYAGCRVVATQATPAVPTAPPQRASKVNRTGENGGAGPNPIANGFSFVNCTVEAAAGAGDKVYLGRAWGDSSYFVYVNTKMANEVVPIGYDRRSLQQPAQGTGAYYGVFNCTGPGFDASTKMGWPKKTDSGFPYDDIDFIDGTKWILPQPVPTD